MGPVEQLRLNLGAPGDKVDAAGDVWFAFPRPSTDGPRGAGGMGRIPFDKLLPVELAEDRAAQPEFHNPDWTPIEGTEQRWLACCGLAGPLKLQVQLATDGAAEARYRVRLLFCELDDLRAAGPLDVLLQGRPVLSAWDMSREAGGPRRAIWREFEVDARERLTVEVRPHGKVAGMLNAVQIEKIAPR